MTFGKKPDSIVANIDWEDEYDVLSIEMINAHKTHTTKEQSTKQHLNKRS